MADADLTESNGGALVGTAVSFLILTTISVALRCYVRGVLTKSFKADDWLMLVAQAIFTMSCSFILVGVHYGIGHHDKALQQRDEINALMYQALATATYVADMAFIKLSIAVFLLRLAVQKRYKYTLWISMAIVAIWSGVIFFWDIFQCKPVQAQWDYTILNSQCVTTDQIVSAAYSISVMTIVTDWLYALLPIPMVWKVKMSKQAKATVVVILGLGIFASIATLIRLKFLADLNDAADILFAGTDAMVWTLVEPGVAIMASSLVTIRPLLQAWRVRGFESSDNTSSRGRTGGRSGAPKSNTQRSYRGAMPGGGPGDLTLIDMETGGREADYGADYDPQAASQATTLTNRSAVRDPDRAYKGERSRNGMTAPGSGTVRSVKSEVYIIEGPARSPSTTIDDDTWRPRSARSDEELNVPEIESHHSGKVGLRVAR